MAETDLIERQVAIDALNKMCDVVCQYSKKQRDVMCGACTLGNAFDVIEALPNAEPDSKELSLTQKALDTISRQAAINALENTECELLPEEWDELTDAIMNLPSAQPEIIRCKDCKWWRQQTNYQGAPLSFGFCESDDMWRSLYGETYEVSHIDTDDDFYCGYAERKNNV